MGRFKRRRIAQSQEQHPFAAGSPASTEAANPETPTASALELDAGSISLLRQFFERLDQWDLRDQEQHDGISEQ
jgi:hypothetical protein